MNLKIPQNKLKELCEKWQIKELAFFGSVLRDDFDPQKSDIDILVTFNQGANLDWSFFTLKNELEALFERPVDLIRKEALLKSKNPYRKKSILDSHKVIYEQAS